MDKTKTFEVKPFIELLEYLKTQHIFVDHYKCYEYFVRLTLENSFLEQRFEDESFSLKSSTMKMHELKNLWSTFETENNMPWGLHPFFQVQKDIDFLLVDFEYEIQKLPGFIANDLNHFAINKLKADTNLFCRDAKKQIDKILKANRRYEFYRNEQLKYIIASKLIAADFFKKLDSKMISKLLKLKYFCYFHDKKDFNPNLLDFEIENSPAEVAQKINETYQMVNKLYNIKGLRAKFKPE